jgi:hypothetical protein
MPDGAPKGTEGGGYDIRELKGTDADAQNDFEHLTVGAKLMDSPSYKGVLTQLPGGGIIG